MPCKHVVLILDKSESMKTIADVAVSNYNEHVTQLQTDAREGIDLRVGLITFNAHVDEHFWEEPPARLELAAREGYQPSGLTNIWDALGHALDRWKDLLNASGADEFLIILISDGDHNVRGRWTAERLRSALTEYQASGRLTTAFLGCELKVLGELNAIGVPTSNLGLWSNASRKAAAHSNRQAGAALHRWTTTRSAGPSNYYSPDVDRVADFTTAEPVYIGLDAAPREARKELTAGGSLALRAGVDIRHRGGKNLLRYVASSASDVPIASDVLVGASAPMTDDSLPEPDLLIGTADVFGKATRVS
jgi:hypothetical protein